MNSKKLESKLCLGVDISLNSMGLSGRLLGEKTKLTSISLSENVKSNRISQRFQGYRRGIEKLRSFLDLFPTTEAIVCLEYYSLQSKSTSLVQIVEYSSMVKNFLIGRYSGEFYEPTITQLKKFATGYGGSAKKPVKKQDIKLGIYKTWRADFTNRPDDEADAFVLMKIAESLAQESAKLTAAQKEVLQAVRKTR